MRTGCLVVIAVCWVAMFFRNADAADDPKPAAVELQIYDVSDLVKTVTDYPGPTVVPGGLGFTVVDPFATPAPQTGFKVPDLVTLLHDRVYPAAFADQNTSIAENNGSLIVVQTPEIQKKIRVYISKLRETIKPQVVVKGVLIAAADAPAANILDAAAFSKMTAALPAESVLGAPRLICYNGQLVHTQSGHESSIIRDFDAAGAVYSPVIASVFDGYVFEVRPTLNSDRSSADVNLRFTFNQQQPKVETRSILLAPPIAEHNPEKALNAGTPPLALTIDEPTVNVQHLSTTLHAPLNKWVLAGVMNNPNPDAPEKRLLFFVSVEPAWKSAVPAGK